MTPHWSAEQRSERKPEAPARASLWDGIAALCGSLWSMAWPVIMGLGLLYWLIRFIKWAWTDG